MGAYSIRDAGIVKQRAIVLRACRLHSPAWRTTAQEMRRPRGSVKVPLKPVHAFALPACRPSRFVVSLGRRDDHRCVGKALLLTDTTLALPGAFAISSGGGDVGTFHPASASWLILSYIVPLRSTGCFFAQPVRPGRHQRKRNLDASSLSRKKMTPSSRRSHLQESGLVSKGGYPRERYSRKMSVLSFPVRRKAWQRPWRLTRPDGGRRQVQSWLAGVRLCRPRW